MITTINILGWRCPECGVLFPKKQPHLRPGPRAFTRLCGGA